jgi:UDP-glucose 4-epimerase
MRFFNIVGPRQTGRYGMVLPTFARQALSNLPITVYGDGKQVRSFTYVSDAVDAMVALADNPAAVGEVFNVGSEETVDIGSLAQRVKEAAHSGSRIEHVPFKVAFGGDFEEPYMRVPDISKLRACVGYEPKVRLHEMIDNVLADSRAQEAVRREGEAPEPTVRAGRSAWPT